MKDFIIEKIVKWKKKDMQLVVNDYIDFTPYIVSQSDKRSSMLSSTSS